MDSRAAFEAWITREMPDLLPLARNFDDYQRVGVQMAWQAWQASQASQATRQQAMEDAAQLCDKRAFARFPGDPSGKELRGFAFSQQWDSARQADRDCAAAIRALSKV